MAGKPSSSGDYGYLVREGHLRGIGRGAYTGLACPSGGDFGADASDVVGKGKNAKIYIYLACGGGTEALQSHPFPDGVPPRLVALRGEPERLADRRGRPGMGPRLEQRPAVRHEAGQRPRRRRSGQPIPSSTSLLQVWATRCSSCPRPTGSRPSAPRLNRDARRRDDRLSPWGLRSSRSPRQPRPQASPRGS